jgi:hypothetical protein
MNTVERIPARTRRLEVSDRSVMVNDWAESLAWPLHATPST